MIKRIFYGLGFLFVIAIAALVVFRPEFINAAIAQYSQFGKYNLSLYDVVHPQIQQRGQVVHVNKARLVAYEDTELSFPVSGTIFEINVKEGMTLKKGQRIASLDTKELGLDRNKAKQSLSRAQADLSRIRGGTRKEDIAIYQSRVSSAATAVRTARENLLETILTAHTTIDNALGSKFQSIVSVGRNERAVVEVFIPDEAAKNDIINQREAVTILMNQWKNDIASANVDSDVFSSATLALDSVRTVRDMFDFTGNALNAFRDYTASTASARSVVVGLRSEANTVITQITDARAALESAEDAFQVAKNELELKKAGSELDQVRSAEALVEEAKNSLLIAEERLAKSTLVATQDDMVVKKVYYKTKEVVSAGQPIVLLAAHGYKFEVDVPEEDIGLLTLGNLAVVTLRSFSGEEIKGEVVSVDEQEVIKNEDTYFRVNIFPTTLLKDVILRTGMTGSVDILTGKSKDVITLPESAVLHDGSKDFVLVQSAQKIDEVRVTTGPIERGFVQVIGPLSTSTAVLVKKP